MSTDWFYALHEIFSFYACSENQFVNLLKYRLYTVQKSEYEAKSDSMQSTLRDLIYHKKLLDRHLEGMQQMSALVKHHADTAQMHAASAPHTLSLENNLQPDATTLRPAALRLSADFDHLLRVANALAYQYKECMEDLRNKAQLHESQQAIEQAKGMAHLTLLAFLFVPLSFTTSFFGMNFTEIGEQRNLSIWIWVTFSIPIMILSLLVCFWSKISSKIRHLRRTK
jgi:Mg2+ and Co2+ transporter CorA